MEERDPLPPADPMGSPPVSGCAAGSLALGIVAALAAVIPFVNLGSYPLSVAAIVLGLLGLRAVRRRSRRGRGMALTGIVLGSIALVVATAVLVATSLALYDNFTVDVDTSAAGGADGSIDDPLPFGSTVTMENGLVVSVGEPRTVPPHAGAAYSWSVEITIENTGRTLSSFYAVPAGSVAGVGACATAGSTGIGDEESELGAGATFSRDYTFDCPSPGPPVLAIAPDRLGPRLVYAS